MKILIACEFSGIVRDEFSKLGHDVWSCDILPSERHGNHIQCDVREILNDGWDMMIAHPPCTHLSLSGQRWFAEGKKDMQLQLDAVEFVKMLMNCDIDKIAIENPIGVLPRYIRKYDQIIRPFQFGENSTKGTCLWLKNLPLLKPTNIINPTKHITKSGKSYDEWWFKTCLISDLEVRAKERSRTFYGIAKAMAE